MNRITAQIIADIIRTEMNLPEDAVWLRDQNRQIPNDNGMYVVVGLMNATTVANQSYMQEIDGEQHQITNIQQNESIQIDILSHSAGILTQNWEIIGALQSFYSQQQQEKNFFKIARIPQSMTNTSSAEGGYIINRYTVVIHCLVWYRKDTLITSSLGDYYDHFETRVDDELTIGTDTPIVDFTLPNS